MLLQTLAGTIIESFAKAAFINKQIRKIIQKKTDIFISGDTSLKKCSNMFKKM
jgi:hypothetical protein